MHATSADAGQQLLLRDQECSIAGTSNNPCVLAIEAASGIWLTDFGGRKYMDMYGNNCHHLGHGHPRLIRALQRQLEELTSTSRGLANAPAVELAQALRTAAHWPDAKVVSGRTGADAIETAIAIARASTGRYKMLAFLGAYHGRSAGALSLGGRAIDRRGLGPLLPGVTHVPPPFPHGSYLHGTDPEAYARESIDAVRSVLEYEGDVCALVAETIRNGAYAAPDWYWPQVKRLCERHGTVLVLDEIATGLGKTGALFNYSQYGIRPDMVVLGKSLGGGVVAQSAVLVDARLKCPEALNIGYYTHEKNPLSARAGTVTLSILADEKLVENAVTLGKLASARLQAIAERHETVAAVNSAGLMMSVRFHDSTGSRSGSEICDRVYRACVARGVLPAPTRHDTLMFSAPLTIDASSLEFALSVLEESIARPQQ